MRFVLAFNAFKESLTAIELSKLAKRAITRVDKYADVVICPIADGGDGTVEALVHARNGRVRNVQTVDPLRRTITAGYGSIEEGRTSVIEMAKASGLALLRENERSPMRTTTEGTGILLRHALAKGAKEVIVGIGGSATTDAGLGIAKAFGYRVLDKNGRELPPIGASLKAIDRIIKPDTLPKARIRIACDVDNPLFGEKGAAYVYAPQKGASEEEVRILDEGLRNFANVVARDLGKDVTTLKGGGAAGGLGAGLVAFVNGKLVKGARLVIAHSGLETHMANADVVFTGEGAVDDQTAYGKAPAVVARIAKKHRLPCVLVAGKVSASAKALHKKGVTALFSITHAPVTLDDAMANASSYFSRAIEEITRLMKASTGF